MALIITATDFTKTATNAVQYASKLALETDSELLVIHCYSIPITFTDVPIPYPIAEIESEAKRELAIIIDQIKTDFPQLKVASLLIYGDVVSAISEYVEEHSEPWMVVLGNSYNEENHVWGESALLQAFRNLAYPVVAVPDDFNFSHPKKIGFAYDNQFEGSDIALIELRELCKKLDAELHVFFGQPTVIKTDNDEKINPKADLILKELNPLYHVFYQADVDVAIQELAAKYMVDWLVIMPRKHSFLEQFFHRSHTKFLVNNSHVPIVALHQN